MSEFKGFKSIIDILKACGHDMSQPSAPCEIPTMCPNCKETGDVEYDASFTENFAEAIFDNECKNCGHRWRTVEPFMEYPDNPE